MIDAMQQRGFSIRTHQSYLDAVSKLAQYFHQSPDRLQPSQIQEYFVYLVKYRHLSGATCRVYLNAFRFLYLQVLHWNQFDIPIHYPKRAQKIPELLTREEVSAIIKACQNPRHRTMLLVCYGCGLRVSELVALKVQHIDKERHLLRIQQGKGAKDRMVILSDTLLEHLDHYWQTYLPAQWLFPNTQHPERALTITTIQKAFTVAKRKARVNRVGGIHGLRHAYATHQLENGLPLHQLQHQLGHQNIRSTMRYIHWVPSQSSTEPVIDLIDTLGICHE
jgi:site-specific recombinase XerD